MAHLTVLLSLSVHVLCLTNTSSAYVAVVSCFGTTSRKSIVMIASGTNTTAS
jgi:hypothetical protein